MKAAKALDYIFNYIVALAVDGEAIDDEAAALAPVSITLPSQYIILVILVPNPSAFNTAACLTDVETPEPNPCTDSATAFSCTHGSHTGVAPQSAKSVAFAISEVMTNTCMSVESGIVTLTSVQGTPLSCRKFIAMQACSMQLPVPKSFAAWARTTIC